jgi:hypothetical protein
MPDPLPPPPPDEVLTAHLEAAATLQDLPLAPEWRAEVLASLRVLAASARFVEAFPLEDEAEPAPRYEP